MFSMAAVFRLTSAQQYRLRIEMKQASDNRWFSTEYSSFLIGDGPNDKYRLNVYAYKLYSGDAAGNN